MTLHLWWAANLKQYLAVYSYMAFTVCCRCIYGVQWAPIKTDRQVINKKCSRDVPGNARGQFIDLQSKTCHSQDTTCWDNFLWVDLTIECGPNSDSNSVVPEIYWTENGQFAFEASPFMSHIPYWPVVSQAFSETKQRLTACCFCAKASWRYLPDSLCGPSCHNVA